MSKSIRYYFFSSIAAVLISSILVLGIIQSYLFTSYFTSENETKLGQVVTGVAQGMQEGEVDPTGENLHTLNYMAQVAGATIFVTNASGQILFGAAQGEASSEQIPPLEGTVPQKLLEQIPLHEVYAELGTLGGVYKMRRYTAALSIVDERGNIAGYIFASNTALGLMVYVSEMMSSFLLSAALVLLLSSLLALVLSGRMIIPIRRIGAAARKFGAGDYSARAPVEGDSELAQLAITFNEMASSFEATNVSRRSFMGNIAHELRTPMTTIKGFIDGMLDGTIPEAQRDKYLTIVSEEVGRLARLTRNMLDISKLEAGEYVPNNTSFDIWGPLATVFINSEKRITEKKITLTGMEEGRPAMVVADEDFVHQILLNLVDNAIKFAGEKGTISVSVTAAKALVTIGIGNTGGGIPREALPYIFDRFYKADKSRGINAKGSGLGLHICKVLLGLMGGRIWAESQEGKNSVFYFTLPAAPQKKPNHRKTAVS